MPFNHFDDGGRAVMVGVGGKEPTSRTAVARATVLMRRETVAAITGGGVKKGDVLGIGRIAGIAAAKKTSDLIPLAHPIVASVIPGARSAEQEQRTVGTSEIPHNLAVHRPPSLQGPVAATPLPYKQILESLLLLRG